MTYLYAQVSPIVRLRAFFAALALVSLFAFCAPNAKADVIYTYVAADSPLCGPGVGPACAYNAGTWFTIDSPGFIPYGPTAFTYIPVTTSDDLYSFPTNYGPLLDVVFLSEGIMGGVAASNYSTPTFLWSGDGPTGYDPEVAGVYTDAVGDTLTVTVTPEPYTAVLSLTGMAAVVVETMRRRLAGRRRTAAA
jgi:hypothetical protein